MTSLIFVSLSMFSIWWLFQYAEITQTIREKIHEKTWSYDKYEMVVRLPWLVKLYNCPYCFCYHLGWIYYLSKGFGFEAFFYAFPVAIVSYWLTLFDKWLLKKTL